MDIAAVKANSAPHHYAAHFSRWAPLSTSLLLGGADFISSTPESRAFSSFSTAAARWLSKDRYVCHPMAITPPKMLLYSSGIKANMKAVIAGQILQLLIHEVGTVFFMRSMISGGVAPERKDCMPKK
jgi:hypothetical protein